VRREEEELFRRLAINDEAATLGAVNDTSPPAALDPKICALTRLAALIAIDSSVASYQWATDLAVGNGATEEEVVAVLMAVAPIVGLARLTSAAPELALALGYDVEQALE
jgi:alkylhydroperoxidase/carboxymuconolactone decarboxylase family protein YurZ